MLDLEAIRARCAAATPGPWLISQDQSAGEYLAVTSWPEPETMREFDDRLIAGGLDDSAADADFIASARTDIPALLAELETTRALIKALEENAVLAEGRHGAEVGKLIGAANAALAHIEGRRGIFSTRDPKTVIQSLRQALGEDVSEHRGLGLADEMGPVE